MLVRTVQLVPANRRMKLSTFTTATSRNRFPMKLSARAAKASAAKATVLALAAMGVFHVIGTSSVSIVKPATAESKAHAEALPAGDWEYFPALFENHGADVVELYIEQF